MKYGVPQSRRRLILLASLHGPIALPPTTNGPGTDRPYETVRNWIGTLPAHWGRRGTSDDSKSSGGPAYLNVTWLASGLRRKAAGIEIGLGVFGYRAMKRFTVTATSTDACHGTGLPLD